MKNPKIESDVFFQEETTDWEDVSDGITRQFVGFNTQLMMVKIKFEKGAIGTLHNHFHSQVSYVAAGEFRVSIDGEDRTLKTGDGFYVSPNINHGVECLDPGMLIDVFSPVREDFLK
jgi:quercetin dioxygenase-like cupin family protein